MCCLTRPRLSGSASGVGVLVEFRKEYGYLAAVTAPLLDPRIGAVTCLYKGVAADGRWSELGALHINFGFLPSALVAESLGLGGGCFGATIALRRETLERIGGFRAIADYIADDYQLGHRLHALGLRNIISEVVVSTRLSSGSNTGLPLNPG